MASSSSPSSDNNGSCDQQQKEQEINSGVDGVCVCVGVPSGTRITIPLPDDFHHHARDGCRTRLILEHARERFGRCLLMPNLKPPITTTERALAYKRHVQECISSVAKADENGGNSNDGGGSFEPLYVLYLTDNTTAEEIIKAKEAGIVGCKYYPAGATTNSEFGVSDIRHCYGALREMAKPTPYHPMMLCIHSEVTHGDIFEREIAFIDEVIKPLVVDFPDLKITMEHISTKRAVDYVRNEAPDNVKASITSHHLLYNRNHLLVGGIRPHLYCLPILKRETDRVALLEAATSGNPKFFLGTDSAPHSTADKETACGCAGVYTAHAAIELLAEAFESVNALDKLGDFCSTFGAQHYGLPSNPSGRRALTLEKKPWTVPERYAFQDGTTLTPLRAGEQVQWSIVSS